MSWSTTGTGADFLHNSKNRTKAALSMFASIINMERRGIVTTTEELSTLSDRIGLSDTSRSHLVEQDAAVLQGHGALMT
jgi:hypothetical protein